MVDPFTGDDRMTGKPVSDAMPPGTTSGTPQALFAHLPKQLKLPTVLHENDEVARECARDGVDHFRGVLGLFRLGSIGGHENTPRTDVIYSFGPHLRGGPEAGVRCAMAGFGCTSAASVPSINRGPINRVLQDSLSLAWATSC